MGNKYKTSSQTDNGVQNMANKKVLIVDDDTNICELLRLYLEKDGFDTVIANDGEAAVAKFNIDEPDIILLDIMLP